MAGMLEEYELGDLLGSGSSAQVYWAQRLRDEELVAIKVVDKLQHAQLRTQSKSQARSEEMQELAIQRSLDHPNILKILDVFQDARNVFIVLEPCARGSLQALVKGKRPVVEDEAKHYVYQLVSGVDYLHRAHIIHRDLKLSNLLVTEQGTLKIADFGLATSFTRHTPPSTICGTPNFIAPEVLLGKPYSYAADLWSIGCIVFTLLTGHPPFQGDSVSDTLRNISAQTSSLAFPPFVSSTAQDFVRSLLCVEPAERLPCHALSHHPWLQPTTARRKAAKTKRPARSRRAPAVVVAESSSSSSQHSEKSDVEDEDIAKLQTMLDKITASDRRAPRGAVTAVSAEPTAVEDDPLPSFHDHAEFQVEYHSILDLPPDEIMGTLHCTWTPEALTLSGRRGEVVRYSLHDARVTGQLRDETLFDVCITDMAPSLPRTMTWVRLAQVCLHLYLSAPRSMIETLRLSDDVIESLARNESLERTIRAQQQAPHRFKTNSDSVRSADLFGIGRGECLADGTLRIAFVDGSELVLDGGASTVEFREPDGGRYEQYPLGASAVATIPSAISRKLKYVSLFVQAMKKQRPSTSQ
ncbi:PLK protein kinase [Saprolegnia parasitica CBS 223.65]|uniref:PLK protein kinase n=1 Tax=Saprolegnia parasitica (strain CBS 223.65) TaxID=695850 RepID=A0A067CSG2_SAPPC|nr:PLK protein kinase [Saprolegnia parasitica CBS 223.65]KDO33468.1 PLK protein kinase [Saprolegnia parasitica CBS 223.65]|eukprot:XP_012196212.1 PLK protein kinase [Saprolegnia parasitica CBS 223.65]